MKLQIMNINADKNTGMVTVNYMAQQQQQQPYAGSPPMYVTTCVVLPIELIERLHTITTAL